MEYRFYHLFFPWNCVQENRWCLCPNIEFRLKMFEKIKTCYGSSPSEVLLLRPILHYGRRCFRSQSQFHIYILGSHGLLTVFAIMQACSHVLCQGRVCNVDILCMALLPCGVLQHLSWARKEGILIPTVPSAHEECSMFIQESTWSAPGWEMFTGSYYGVSHWDLWKMGQQPRGHRLGEQLITREWVFLFDHYERVGCVFSGVPRCVTFFAWTILAVGDF